MNKTRSLVSRVCFLVVLQSLCCGGCGGAAELKAVKGAVKAEFDRLFDSMSNEQREEMRSAIWGIELTNEEIDKYKQIGQERAGEIVKMEPLSILKEMDSGKINYCVWRGVCKEKAEDVLDMMLRISEVVGLDMKPYLVLFKDDPSCQSWLFYRNVAVAYRVKCIEAVQEEKLNTEKQEKRLNEMAEFDPEMAEGFRTLSKAIDELRELELKL